MRTEAAYEACREVARTEARNFYFGFVLLPPDRRAAIYAAYAFSRRADDSVDGTESLDAKLAAVAARRAELDACYRGTPDPSDLVLVALADTVRRYGIPRRHLDALLDGVEMDLTMRRYASWDELEPYCDRVAGAVGIVSLYIFGFGDDAAPAHARDLGVGMQIINIMRDVREDAERDRIYLPADEMADHGVSEEQLLAGETSEGFRALMAQQAERAHHYVERGERLLPLLDRRARMCVAMLSGLYREILADIEAAGFDVVLDRRVSLSTRRKLGLMAQRSAGALSPA